MNNGVLTTTSGAGMPFDSSKNFADHEETRTWIQRNLKPLIEHARYDRQTLEEEWREVRRMVLLEHDNNRKYVGRSEAYVPAYARARDTLISQLSRALFPSDDYLDVRVRKEDSLEESRAAKEYLHYEFEKQARVRSNIKEFLSQFVDYGFSVAKAWYEKGNSYRQLRAVKKESDLPVIIESSQKTGGEGSRFSTRSVFYWYIWPTTVSSVDEATLCFEDIDVSLQDARRLESNGIWVNVEVANAGFGGEALHDMNIRMQEAEIRGMAMSPRDNPASDSELARMLTATECWLDMPIPASEYAPDEKPGSPVPCKVTLIGDVVVEARRNPFFHQKKPYLAHRMRTFPGSFYPKGAGQMGRYLQYLINDFTNQLNDNGTFAMNPLVMLNPSQLGGPLPAIRPGAVIPVNDPNAIKFDRPPIEQLQHGSMLVSNYLSMLQDMVGAPPILQGTNAGKGARTATSAQILQRNASNPIQDVVEDMENDVLVPFMHMVWSFGNQYRTTPLVDEVGGSGILIRPDDIMGDVVMRFLASSQAVNQQQRAQQAMMLLQILPPLVPLLQANGKMVDPTPLIQRIYSDGFGFRNFADVVKDVPQQGMPGQGGGLEQMLGGEPAPGENAGDSAIPEEQSPVQGEGEDFANVRDNADSIAAVLGGLGGAA